MKGCCTARDSGQKEPRKKDSSARTGQKTLQMWTRLCGGAFRRSLWAVPKQFTEKTQESHGRLRKSFRQQILQRRYYLLASLQLIASHDARTC